MRDAVRFGSREGIVRCPQSVLRCARGAWQRPLRRIRMRQCPNAAPELSPSALAAYSTFVTESIDRKHRP